MAIEGVVLGLQRIVADAVGKLVNGGAVAALATIADFVLGGPTDMAVGGGGLEAVGTPTVGVLLRRAAR